MSSNCVWQAKVKPIFREENKEITLEGERTRQTFINISVLNATLAVLTLCVLCCSEQPAYADHFRYAHISWVPGAGSNQIDFTFDVAFKRSKFFGSAPDGKPAVGDNIVDITGSTNLSFGDGTSTPALWLKVISIDSTNNWLLARALDPTDATKTKTTISHTYSASGDYTAFINGFSRILATDPPNEHINNPGGSFRVETLVNVGTGNSSPRSALPPVVLCPQNGLCSFIVPGADPDPDSLNFRLSTPSEASSSGDFNQPGPPEALNSASISSTGTYTWDTTGAQVASSSSNNTLYSTQVTIEDKDGEGNVKSKSAVDFLIQLVPVAGAPPAFDHTPTPACGSTINGNVGSPISFTVQASDTDSGQTVTLNAVGLPPGATMTPALPANGNPVSSVFSWTPGPGEDSVYVMTFTATDNTGLQTLCSHTLEVSAEVSNDQIVTIDIKPGSNPNSINRKSKGKVPVAILSSPTFDATAIDRNTVLFAGASPLPIGKSPKDVNGDGLLDVVLHFKTRDLDLQRSDTEACLHGYTLDGQEFEGCDSVRIVK